MGRRVYMRWIFKVFFQAHKRMCSYTSLSLATGGQPETRNSVVWKHTHTEFSAPWFSYLGSKLWHGLKALSHLSKSLGLSVQLYTKLWNKQMNWNALLVSRVLKSNKPHKVLIFLLFQILAEVNLVLHSKIYGHLGHNYLCNAVYMSFSLLHNSKPTVENLYLPFSYYCRAQLGKAAAETKNALCTCGEVCCP